MSTTHKLVQALARVSRVLVGKGRGRAKSEGGRVRGGSRDGDGRRDRKGGGIGMKRER